MLRKAVDESNDCVLAPPRRHGFLHVGCGVGYYTAVLAEVVGPSGDVLGLEIDRELATDQAEM